MSTDGIDHDYNIDLLLNKLAGQVINNINQINQTVINAIAGQLRLTQASFLGAGRALDTIYQNTSENVRFVAVTAEFDTTGGSEDNIVAVVNAFSPPTTIVCQSTMQTGTAITNREMIFFLVPPNSFYRVNSTGATLRNWSEWELGLEAVPP